MKHLYILRGPSGCGKSTLAYKLIADFERIASVCSADSFFGEPYRFDATKLTEAHNACKSLCEKSMQDNADVIVIDNTNMKVWEYAPYIEYAKQYGYSYSLVIVGQPWDAAILAKRNIHGLTEEQIRLQISRFAHFV